jgi:hypothetical protein
MIDDEREVHEVGHRCHMLTIVNVMYMRGRGVFLKNRSMDNLYLNRMNSRQRIIKKILEAIFEISIGSLRNSKVRLKI